MKQSPDDVTTGWYCWACGANVQGVWHSYIDFGQRCQDCHKVTAPLDPKLVGKLTDMDRLPALRAKHATPRDYAWEELATYAFGVTYPPRD